jgi:predicted DNA-binding transcriptional regulator AlpA
MTQTQHIPITKADLPRLMTRAEVADYLNISVGTLANWNSAGTGPTPVKWNSQSVMYLPEDVLDWVHSKRAE